MAEVGASRTGSAKTAHVFCECAACALTPAVPCAPSPSLTIAALPSLSAQRAAPPPQLRTWTRRAWTMPCSVWLMCLTTPLCTPPTLRLLAASAWSWTRRWASRAGAWWWGAPMAPTLHRRSRPMPTCPCFQVSAGSSPTGPCFQRACTLSLSPHTPPLSPAAGVNVLVWKA